MVSDLMEVFKQILKIMNEFVEKTAGTFWIRLQQSMYHQKDLGDKLTTNSPQVWKNNQIDQPILGERTAFPRVLEEVCQQTILFSRWS